MAIGDTWKCLCEGIASRISWGEEVLARRDLENEEQVRGTGSRVNGGALEAALRLFLLTFEGLFWKREGIGVGWNAGGVRWCESGLESPAENRPA